ncbi:hypothetical protein [Streptomyces colonosanans]|uniref:Uncharacterized protein n=1 Tax=Streptomyces colonosanans TaxID=1428652 RepID=A0A1S2PPH2_9ACTN|nr:hypothetical protein [Streptomyces colonosanans]OIJ95436.1 hypothetical protein BIV24_09155 [Streptomyces colonosanans]
MTTTALYEIETHEADDGTTHPAEQLWTPCLDDAPDNGFIVHRGLYVIGIDGPTGDHLYPVGFIALGHHQWTDIIEGATAYMASIHGWRNLHLYPGDDPSVLIPRIPRAAQTHGVFLRHLHPDHPCGCEWEGTWRMVWAPPTEPGAVPVTALRHPAAPATAAGIPNPDHEAMPATWAA